MSSLSKIQPTLDRLAQDLHVPGASVGVLADGQVSVFTTGVSSLDSQQPVTPDTLFQIGSNTKLYTATLVLQLVDEGRVELAAPVRRYLPSFRLADDAAAARITVRHLLTHSSGIDGDYFGPDEDFDENAITRFVESMDQLGLVHPVGELWSYCNAGFAVLGSLIENVVGAPYDQALRSRLLEPLGLTRTAQRPPDGTPDVAKGHLPLGEGGAMVVSPIQWFSPGSAPAGSLLTSTPAEVLAFIRLHLDGGRGPDGRQLLSPESVTAMQTPQVSLPLASPTSESAGLAWGLGQAAGHRLIGHGGGTLGQLSTLMCLPDDGVAVVVLTNGPTGAVLGRQVAELVFDQVAGVQLPKPEETPATADPVDLGRFAGRYQGHTTTVDVTVAEGRLLATMSSAPLAAGIPSPSQQLYLEPVGEDRFKFAGSSPAQVVKFLPGSDPDRSGYLFMGRALPRRAEVPAGA